MRQVINDERHLHARPAAVCHDGKEQADRGNGEIAAGPAMKRQRSFKLVSFAPHASISFSFTSSVLTPMCHGRRDWGCGGVWGCGREQSQE